MIWSVLANSLVLFTSYCLLPLLDQLSTWSEDAPSPPPDAEVPPPPPPEKPPRSVSESTNAAGSLNGMFACYCPSLRVLVDAFGLLPYYWAYASHHLSGELGSFYSDAEMSLPPPPPPRSMSARRSSDFIDGMRAAMSLLTACHLCAYAFVHNF